MTKASISIFTILAISVLSAQAQRSVPYFEDFSSIDDFNTYTIIDGYNDGSTWELNEGAADLYAWCRYNSNNPKDEWFISPAITLQAGKTYTLKFKSFAYNPDWPEHLEVCLGQGTTAECMTQVVMAKEKLSNDIDHYYTHTLTVEADGDYNIGFHACSARDMHMLVLDKVSLTEGGQEEKDYSESDIPSAVSNITLREKDGVLTLRWDAPTVGAHGGKLAPGLKYKVRDNHEMAPITIEATAMEIDGYEFDRQTLTYFTITPINNEGEGPSAISNYVLLGGDYHTLPILDTFDNGPITSIYWNYIGYWHIFGYNGIVPDYEPYDGRGCLYTVPTSQGEQSLFFSGNISLEGSINPAFDFYYYNLPNSQNRLEVLVSVETDDWQIVKSVPMSADLAEGWHQAKAELSEFKDCRYLQVAIRSVAAADCSPLLIDHFQLHDILDKNLAIEAFDIPALATAGTLFHSRTLVQNVGLQDAQGYTVQLFRDGVLRQEVQGPVIAVGESALIEIADCALATETKAHSYSAHLLWDEDENNINNSSLPQDIWIEVNSSHPVPQALAANADPTNASHFTLSWEPIAPFSSVMLTENFEDYPAFTVTKLGPWGTYDADGQTTYYAASSKYPSGYPNASEPKAWQVLNLEKLGFNSYNSYFSTKSGIQILSAFVTDNPDVSADDWLLSPELSGQAHTLSFWACSPVAEVYGCDQYEVLGSTTGRQAEDFTQTLVARQDAPGRWTKIRVEVPQGIKYVAIRHTAGDTFLMSLDDVEYSAPAPLLLGYNVYADGVLQNDEPLASATYEGTISDTDQPHQYAVTAVYENAESALSQQITVEVSGIEAIAADQQKASFIDLYGRRVDANAIAGRVVIDDKGKVLLHK